MSDRTVHVRLRASNHQYNIEMAKSGRLTKMAMGVSERAIADNAKAMADMEKSATGMQRTLARPVKPRVNTKPALRDVETLEDRLNKLTFRQTLITVAVAGLPVAVAGMTALTGLLAGSVALFASAGAGAAAFGGVAAASLKRVTEARKELLQEGADRQAILSTLTDAQRGALREVNALSDAWASFQDRTDPAVLGAMGQSMQALRAALPGLEGLVTPVAGAFEDFMSVITRNVSSPGFTAFMGDLGTMASGTLSDLGKTAINAAYGVGNLVKAFSGLGGGISEGLVRLSDQFATWSEGVPGSDELERFMSYLREVGPQLVATLSSVGEALLNIGQAAAPFAGPMLTVIQALANLVNTANGIHPVLLQAAVGVGIFVAASRTIGSALITPMQRMRGMQEAMGALPTFAGRAGIALGGLASAMGGSRGIAGAAGFAALSLGGIADQSTGTGKALSALGTTASGALLGFSAGGPIGAAIGGGIGLLTGLGQAFLGSGSSADQAAASNVDYTSTLNRVSGAITKTTREMAAAQLERTGVLKDLVSIGLDPGVGVEAVLGDPAAINMVTKAFDDQLRVIERRRAAIYADGQVIGAENQELRNLTQREHDVIDARKNAITVIGIENGQLTVQQASIRRTSAAADGYGQASGRAASGSQALSTSVQQLNNDFATLEGRLADRAAMRGYETSLDAVDERLQGRRDALRGVADAERALADAQQMAADQVESAEEGLADAQDQARLAQENLNAARKEGAEQLQDMRLQLEGAALSEEGARLAVLSARQRLREVSVDPEASGLDRAEADLAYREAKLRLKEVLESNQDLRAEYKRQSKDGVESTDVVVAAREQLTSANEAVTDAEDALTDAVDSGAESIRAARRQLRQLERDLRDFALGLNQGTEAGRTNAEILDNIATKALETAKGLHDAEKRARFMKDARKTFLAAADALEVGEDKARRLANRLLKLPSDVTIHVDADTLKAWRKINRLTRDWRMKVTAELSAEGIRGLTSQGRGTGQRTGGLQETMATGGWVRPGGDVAGFGEFVVNRAASAANASLLEAVNAGTAPRMVSVAPQRTSVRASVSSQGLETQIGRLSDRIDLLAARGGGVTFGDVYAQDIGDAKRQAQRSRRQQNVGGIRF